MSQTPNTENYNLALSPHTRTEIQAATSEIVAWLDGGAVLPETPVDALTKRARQILAVGNRDLNDLADSATRQVMSLEWKQGYLDGFRKVFELRDGNGLDVAGLRAEAENLRGSEASQENEAEESGKVAKRKRLVTLLQEMEALERRFGEQVVELEAEAGLR